MPISSKPLKREIRRHTDLDVYHSAFQTSMKVFAASKKFPKDERYSRTDQIRRASRSVAANIAEAWRKRRYPAAFVSKLSDAEGEAAETQFWLQFAVESKYLERSVAAQMYRTYDEILGMLVNMIVNAEQWKLNR